MAAERERKVQGGEQNSNSFMNTNTKDKIWAHLHQMKKFKTKINRSHQSTLFNFILF